MHNESPQYTHSDCLTDPMKHTERRNRKPVGKLYRIERKTADVVPAMPDPPSWKCGKAQPPIIGSPSVSRLILQERGSDAGGTHAGITTLVLILESRQLRRESNISETQHQRL